MVDDWYLMNDAWWLMADDWWLMINGWWLMADNWWLMIDGWGLMADDWWMMIDGWLLPLLTFYLEPSLVRSYCNFNLVRQDSLQKHNIRQFWIVDGWCSRWPFILEPCLMRCQPSIKSYCNFRFGRQNS